MLTAEQKKLADALLEIGAVKFGAFRLKIHDTKPDAPLSPFYLDLRLLRSFPTAKKKAVRAYLRLLRTLKFDVLADVPTAATPLVASIADVLRMAQITPRMDKKAHGTGAKVDGFFRKGQTAVLVDDLVTHARSKLEAIRVLEQAGLRVKDVVVLVDREQGGAEELAQEGYKLHSILQISKLFAYYADTGKIGKKSYRQILDYIGD